MIEAIILEAPLDSDIGYQPFGGALKLWSCKDPEVMIAGPAETGKTLAWLHKLDTFAWKYAGAHLAIVRKTRQSMDASVLKTFHEKVLGAWNPDLNDGEGGLDQSKTPVIAYGGNKPQWYDYPNGTRIEVAGIDRPSRLLSSEFDLIYVNQSEELTLEDWELLSTRTTGRAGKAPYGQLGGDCNPSASTHWIRLRAQDGKMTFFESRHEDNPTLYDPETGELTRQGAITMGRLDNLTGVRKARLRHGKWVSAEGAVYEEFDEAVHVLDRFDIPSNWMHYRVVDFGYTNPFVCQWWAADGDGRLYMYREIYMSGKLVEDHARQIIQLTSSQRAQDGIADHDAEDRATLHRHGVKTVPADKRVQVGIQAVQARLRPAGDGKPRIFFLRDSLVEEDSTLREAFKPTHTVAEFPDYIWQKSADGKPVKEEPVKVNDHGMDAMRYMVMHLDGEVHEPPKAKRYA